MCSLIFSIRLKIAFPPQIYYHARRVTGVSALSKVDVKREVGDESDAAPATVSELEE